MYDIYVKISIHVCIFVYICVYRTKKRTKKTKFISLLISDFSSLRKSHTALNCVSIFALLEVAQQFILIFIISIVNEPAL